VATDYEKDVKLVCSALNEKEVKAGTSGKYYICKSSAWQIATEYEYDTYGWGSCSMEGEIKKGNVSDTKYICQNSAWRLANWYELDVGGFGNCSAEGEVKKGNVSENNYVCKYEIWRIASYKDIVCFKEKNCNYFTDTRDNQRYAYVVIGAQTWMAENLNYGVNGERVCYNNEANCINNSGRLSVCYDDNEANCINYGRLYEVAKLRYEPFMVVCPTGWHLPNDDEWTILIDFVGSNAETKLRSSNGWNVGKNGTDEFGFTALPGGAAWGGGGFAGGVAGDFLFTRLWSASGSFVRLSSYGIEIEECLSSCNADFFSIRCLKD